VLSAERLGRVRNADGAPVPDGAPGELPLHGPLVSSGYRSRPEAGNVLETALGSRR
jgi:non-ribosomal peptide synthetase component E (peptide arylation enzyme)